MLIGGPWEWLGGGSLAAAAVLGWPPSGRSRLRRVLPGAGEPSDGPAAARTARYRPGGSRTALPGPQEVAALAEQLAGLSRAGLPTRRAWPVLAERAGNVPVRRIARAVAEAHGRAESTAPALRAAIASLGGGSGSFRGTPGKGAAGARALALLAVAIDVSERSGAGLADTLDRFATGLRADLYAQQEREAALAGPRATAWILSLLPLAGLALAALLGGHPGRVLTGTAPGRLCLLAGGLLWLAGRGWTAFLIRRAEAVR